eukprot:jgi/Bigna1/90786/estExt_fgenesh1_pg.C_790053
MRVQLRSSNIDLWSPIRRRQYRKSLTRDFFSVTVFIAITQALLWPESFGAKWRNSDAAHRHASAHSAAADFAVATSFSEAGLLCMSLPPPGVRRVNGETEAASRGREKNQNRDYARNAAYETEFALRALPLPPPHLLPIPSSAATAGEQHVEAVGVAPFLVSSCDDPPGTHSFPKGTRKRRRRFKAFHLSTSVPVTGDLSDRTIIGLEAFLNANSPSPNGMMNHEDREEKLNSENDVDRLLGPHFTSNLKKQQQQQQQQQQATRRDSVLTGFSSTALQRGVPEAEISIPFRVVRALQDFLFREGYKLPLDGKMGIETIEELQAFLQDDARAHQGIQNQQQQQASTPYLSSPESPLPPTPLRAAAPRFVQITGEMDAETVISLQAFLNQYCAPDIGKGRGEEEGCEGEGISRNEKRKRTKTAAAGNGLHFSHRAGDGGEGGTEDEEEHDEEEDSQKLLDYYEKKFIDGGEINAADNDHGSLVGMDEMDELSKHGDPRHLADKWFEKNMKDSGDGTPSAAAAVDEESITTQASSENKEGGKPGADQMLDVKMEASWIAFLRRQVLKDMNATEEDLASSEIAQDRFQDIIQIGFLGFKEQMHRDKREKEMDETGGEGTIFFYRLRPLRILSATHLRMKIACRDLETGEDIVAVVFIGGLLENGLSRQSFEFMRDSEQSTLMALARTEARDLFPRSPSGLIANATRFARWPAYYHKAVHGMDLDEFQKEFSESAYKISSQFIVGRKLRRGQRREGRRALEAYISRTVFKAIRAVLNVAHALKLASTTSEGMFVVSPSRALALDAVTLSGKIRDIEFLQLAPVSDSRRKQLLADISNNDDGIKTSSVPILFPSNLIRFLRNMYQTLTEEAKLHKIKAKALDAIATLESFHGSFCLTASWVLECFRSFDVPEWTLRFPKYSVVRALKNIEAFEGDNVVPMGSEVDEGSASNPLTKRLDGTIFLVLFVLTMLHVVFSQLASVSNLAFSSLAKGFVVDWMISSENCSVVVDFGESTRSEIVHAPPNSLLPLQHLQHASRWNLDGSSNVSTDSEPLGKASKVHAGMLCFAPTCQAACCSRRTRVHAGKRPRASSLMTDMQCIVCVMCTLCCCVIVCTVHVLHFCVHHSLTLVKDRRCGGRHLLLAGLLLRFVAVHAHDVCRPFESVQVRCVRRACPPTQPRLRASATQLHAHPEPAGQPPRSDAKPVQCASVHRAKAADRTARQHQRSLACWLGERRCLLCGREPEKCKPRNVGTVPLNERSASCVLCPQVGNRAVQVAPSSACAAGRLALPQVRSRNAGTAQTCFSAHDGNHPRWHALATSCCFFALPVRCCKRSKQLLGPAVLANIAGLLWRASEVSSNHVDATLSTNVQRQSVFWSATGRVVGVASNFSVLPAPLLAHKRGSLRTCLPLKNACIAHGSGAKLSHRLGVQPHPLHPPRKPPEKKHAVTRCARSQHFCSFPPEPSASGSSPELVAPPHRQTFPWSRVPRSGQPAKVVVAFVLRLSPTHVRSINDEETFFGHVPDFHQSFQPRALAEKLDTFDVHVGDPNRTATWHSARSAVCFATTLARQAPDFASKWGDRVRPHSLAPLVDTTKSKATVGKAVPTWVTAHIAANLNADGGIDPIATMHKSPRLATTDALEPTGTHRHSPKHVHARGKPVRVWLLLKSVDHEELFQLDFAEAAIPSHVQERDELCTSSALENRRGVFLRWRPTTGASGLLAGAPSTSSLDREENTTVMKRSPSRSGVEQPNDRGSGRRTIHRLLKQEQAGKKRRFNRFNENTRSLPEGLELEGSPAASRRCPRRSPLAITKSFRLSGTRPCDSQRIFSEMPSWECMSLELHDSRIQGATDGFDLGAMQGILGGGKDDDENDPELLKELHAMGYKEDGEDDEEAELMALWENEHGKPNNGDNKTSSGDAGNKVKTESRVETNTETPALNPATTSSSTTAAVI